MLNGPNYFLLSFQRIDSHLMLRLSTPSVCRVGFLWVDWLERVVAIRTMDTSETEQYVFSAFCCPNAFSNAVIFHSQLWTFMSDTWWRTLTLNTFSSDRENRQWYWRSISICSNKISDMHTLSLLYFRKYWHHVSNNHLKVAMIISQQRLTIVRLASARASCLLFLGCSGLLALFLLRLMLFAGTFSSPSVPPNW